MPPRSAGRPNLRLKRPLLLAQWKVDWGARRHRRGPGNNDVQDEYPHYIEFRHVYKTFDRPVLVDCSFHLDPGQTLAVIGRSGVGKSVCLQHIMGFLKPDAGRVIVANEDITGFNEALLRPVRRKVTMVFQSGALFDSLTVGENILFSLELRPDYDYENRMEIVRGLLAMVDLANYEEAYPGDLSTGFRRAVAIARALAAQPECILYDEPTTMVDPIMSEHISSLMLRLKKQLGLTSMVVTHDLDLMRKVADKVAFLDRGQAVYFGPVSGLEYSDDPHVQEFLRMDRLDFSGTSLSAVD
jgi:phospholipid/cholesterol/gamma-HCH transport system ATP-binding protein